MLKFRLCQCENFRVKLLFTGNHWQRRLQVETTGTGRRAGPHSLAGVRFELPVTLAVRWTLAGNLKLRRIRVRFIFKFKLTRRRRRRKFNSDSESKSARP